MPPKRKVKKGKAASPPAAVGDRLGDLPNDLLRHVLSFLPAEDAVRTCVLARSWDDLWKSARSLRIVRELRDSEFIVAALKFLAQLLDRRGNLPLDTCQISLLPIGGCGGFEFNDDECFKRWIEQILDCNVRFLTLDIPCEFYFTLVSNHLETLRLSHMCLDTLLDFSSCPALNILQFDYCGFAPSAAISSQSLKFLIIGLDCTFDVNYRARIDTPNLNSLLLTVRNGRIPSLCRMPSLVLALLDLSHGVSDCCRNYVYSGDCWEEECDGCYEEGYESSFSVLLQGLSKAHVLELRSDVKIFMFRRDLMWRPTFDNLRALLLDEYWCVPADFSALAYVLEHAPVLEMLTLELYSKGPKYKFEMKGRWNSTQLSAGISCNLKTVDVKCQVIDERVRKVFKFLGTLGISFSLDEVEIVE